jgi:NADH:ubiquinone oxidoreductase subunit 6 (subunit J)
MGFAGLIALGAREYVGWFVFTCAVLVVLHTALLNLGRGQLRALPVIYAVVAIALVGIPAILSATSSQSLQNNLQPLQNAESTSGVTSTQASGSHLALGPVNFSTRSAVVSNLPQRIRDVLLRPYPWQIRNISQLMGAVGSLVALAGFFLLIRYAFLIRGQVLRRAGPLLYPFLFLTIAYALATGNAGQGFRYRTHLVTLAVAALVVLRAAVIERRECEAAGARMDSFNPSARRAPGMQVPAI